MIPQLGFAEMLVLGLIAIIVVGPKDLPKLMRAIGGFMARIRAMGAEFRQAFDEMGAEDDIAEMRREIEELKKMGQLSNLSDEAFEEDMRAIDNEIRDATDMTSPKAVERPQADDTPQMTALKDTDFVPKKAVPKKVMPKKKASSKKMAKKAPAGKAKTPKNTKGKAT